MSIDSKRRLDWADVAKGIGIILVIAGHSIRDGGALFEIIFKLIYAFHMPLFFSISGFFFSRLNFEKAIGKFVKKKITTQLKPFLMYSLLIWGIFRIAYFVPLLRSILSSAGMNLYGFLDYIKLMLLGDNPYAFHLWYLWVLFLMSVMFYIICHYAKKIGINCFMSCWIIAFAFWSIRMLAVYHAPNGIMTFLRYSIFFVAGMRIPYIVGFKQKGINYLIACVSVIYWGWHTLLKNHSFGKYGDYFMNMLQLLSVFVLIWLIIQFSKKLQHNYFLQYIGKNSMIVYMFHQPFFCAFVGILAGRILGLSSVFVFFISMVSGLLFPLLIIEISKRHETIKKILTFFFSITV